MIYLDAFTISFIIGAAVATAVVACIAGIFWFFDNLPFSGRFK